MILLGQHLADLRQEHGRIALTALGVVWGTLAITTLLAFTESVLHAVRQAEQGMGPGLVVVRAGTTSLAHDGRPPGRPVRLTVEDVEAVRSAVGASANVSAEYFRNGVSVTRGNRTYRAFLSAVEPPYALVRNCRPAPGGRFINEPDRSCRRRAAFLGDELKREIFGGADAVGETIVIRGVPFTVVGVMQSKLQWNYYEAPDSRRLFIPGTTFAALWGPQPVTAVVYRAAAGHESGRVQARVQQLLARRHRFDPTDRFALSVWDTAKGVQVAADTERDVRLFVGLVGAVTLIIAGLGVGNVMYTLVRRRTREIGIKIAVGARPGQITAYYLLEGLTVVVAGGAGGLLVSGLMIVLLNHVPLSHEALVYLCRPTLSPSTVIVVSVILGLIGLGAGLFPARAAAAVRAAEALRHA
jgi:putative ABC transport system permease protein